MNLIYFFVFFVVVQKRSFGHWNMVSPGIRGIVKSLYKDFKATLFPLAEE